MLVRLGKRAWLYCDDCQHSIMIEPHELARWHQLDMQTHCSRSQRRCAARAVGLGGDAAGRGRTMRGRYRRRCVDGEAVLEPLCKISKELAALGRVNLNGRPYSAKSVRSMIRGARPVSSAATTRRAQRRLRSVLVLIGLSITTRIVDGGAAHGLNLPGFPIRNVLPRLRGVARTLLRRSICRFGC